MGEQVKDLHEILNGIVRVLQNLHQNKQNQSSITPPNLSVNIDKNIATENLSEKSHGISLTVIWQPHSQLWAIIEETASLTGY